MSKFCFGQKMAPKEYFWMKISGTDAENHEESENSIEIVKKIEHFHFH